MNKKLLPVIISILLFSVCGFSQTISYPVHNNIPGKQNLNTNVSQQGAELDIATSGIDDLTPMGNDLFIFPNPATDAVTFIFNSNDGVHFKLTITDLSGKLMLEKTLSESNVKIMVKNWAKGAYFYHLAGIENNFDRSGKFVVEK